MTTATLPTAFFTATPRDRWGHEATDETTAAPYIADAVEALGLDDPNHDVAIRLVEATDVGAARLPCVFAGFPLWCVTTPADAHEA